MRETLFSEKQWKLDVKIYNHDILENHLLVGCNYRNWCEMKWSLAYLVNEIRRNLITNEELEY